MAINIQTSEQYQGVIESAGSPQSQSINGDTNIVSISGNTPARINTANIQAALNSGGNIRIIGQGIASINDTLTLYNNTNLTIDAGLTLKLAAGVGRNIFKTSQINAASEATVTIAWTQGLRATVTWTGHGKAIGDYVFFQGADQKMFNGVFLIDSVPTADTFTIQLDRAPSATATGTITAVTPNKNITLNIYGTLDYDSTNNPNGTSLSKLAVILSGVNININTANIKNAPKYCIGIGAVRHVNINNVTFGPTLSDGIKVYGPAYDVKIDGAYGSSEDDFISLQPREATPYIGYVWSYGDIINVSIKNVAPDKTSTSATITMYACDEGEYLDNVTLENIDVINRINIASNEGGTAGSFGNIIIKNIKALDDSGWANGGLGIRIKGTVAGVTLQDTHGSYWQKEFITVTSTATIKKLMVQNCSFLCGSNHIVNNAGVINKLTIRNNNLDNFLTGSYLRLVKNSKTINFLDVHENRCNKLTSAIEQASGVTAGGVISFRNNYISTTYGIFELIENSECIFEGNVGDIFDARHILNINGSGKSVKLTTRDNTITFGTSALFVKRTVGNELVSIFGYDIPIALDILNRAIPGQIAKASASIGTVLINETCVNDTTNAAGSWHQLSNPALVY